MRRVVLLLAGMPMLAMALSNHQSLVSAGIESINAKVPDLHLHIRKGADAKSKEALRGIEGELLEMQLWLEGRVTASPLHFRYLEASPFTENLRHLICNQISCG